MRQEPKEQYTCIWPAVQLLQAETAYSSYTCSKLCLGLPNNEQTCVWKKSANSRHHVGKVTRYQFRLKLHEGSIPTHHLVVLQLGSTANINIAGVRAPA